jgi:hypothetical protein
MLGYRYSKEEAIEAINYLSDKGYNYFKIEGSKNPFDDQPMQIIGVPNCIPDIKVQTKK